MLPKKYRLKHKKDIERVVKEGRYFYGQIFWFKIASNTEGHGRLGLIIPKKSYKRAVDRNHLKRAFTSIIDGEMRKMPNWDIVVYFKKQKMLPTSAQLREEADKLIIATHH